MAGFQPVPGSAENSGEPTGCRQHFLSHEDANGFDYFSIAFRRAACKNFCPMNRVAKFREFFEAELPNALELLKQMVAINSFTTNKEGIRKTSDFTAQAFAPMGFVADTFPSVRAEFGEHLILTRKGRSQKIIALISHLDTVYPPEEEARNNFVWRPSGKKIYGPGIMDIKGGTVMIHLVLRSLAKLAPEVFEEFTWMVLLNSSEEVYSKDFGDLCLQRFNGKAIAALVFESGVREDNRFCLVTARKGRAVFRVEVEGRGAHAGSHHERGANAVVQLAQTVQKIASLTDYSKALTFNVGTVSGGTVLNRVPHFAVAEGEMRAFDRETFREGVAKLLALNADVSVRSIEGNHPCSVKIEVIAESPPWPRNKGTEQLFLTFEEAASEVGIKVLREERGGLSDGNFICHAVPTLDGMGPNGDNAHCSEQSADGSKEQEFVDVASYVPKATLNALAILKLAEQS